MLFCFVVDFGVVFMFGKSCFLDNKFWICDDVVIYFVCGDEYFVVVIGSFD